MSRFIAVIDTPSYKHKLVVLPIFDTIEETEREVIRQKTDFRYRIIDIDWTVEKQMVQNSYIAELLNQIKNLEDQLGIKEN